ncbi:hypothetical protein ACFQ14_09615 [Pseudahrensia aquimaris]|uniref:Uncharacterized protein n=1 Tax=Pseudahrensia aquimaris TaxID=744461 RepID=A0ABW3FFZ5_9HYPH
MMRGAFFAAFFACAGVSAQAAECLQGDAIYEDADKAYALAFSGTGDEGRGMASNRFTLGLKDGKKLLEGSVLWSNGISRPVGVMTYQCPGGDIIAEELDACKIWEGVVYAVYPDGEVDLIPPDTDPAANALLLPDLGRSLRYSKPWTDENLAVVPWDKFSYIGCSQ